MQREFDLVVKELKIVAIKEKLKELGNMISKFEEVKDRKELKKAQESFAKVSDKLAKLEENN